MPNDDDRAALMMLAPCYSCGVPFMSNPELVPSVRDSNNVKQPLCESCITKINVIRKDRGLPLARVPEGAYEPQVIE